MNAQAAPPARHVGLVPIAEVSAVRQGLAHRIAQRAQERFEAAGQRHGADLDHWLAAENDLVAPLDVAVAASADWVAVQVSLPDECMVVLRVGADRQQVLIDGGPAPRSMEAGHRATADEQRLFRVVPLPCLVDPDGGSATYVEGLLTVMLPKAEA